MPPEDGLGCGSQTSSFPNAGAGDVPGYWAQDWSGATACKPATYMTAYDISARDDYKRCVCDLFGEGEADCPNEGEEGGDANPDDGDFEPEDEDDLPDDLPDDHPDHHHLTDFQELVDIREDPHYSDGT